jgi:V/A-type H+-transporting ATPase subunit I
MKRFYLAVPVEYEEAVLRRIVEFGMVQLTRDIPVESAEKNDVVDICKRFARLYDRLESAALVTMEKQAELKQNSWVSFDAIREFVNKAEKELRESTESTEKLQSDIKNLEDATEKLQFLVTNKLRVDEIGAFRHIFVKAGFLVSANLSKLGAYIGGTSVVFIARPGRPRENFVVVTGLNEDLSLTEMVLKLLNFENVTFPEGIDADPEEAIGEIRRIVESKQSDIQRMRRDLGKIIEEANRFEVQVTITLRVEEAKGLVARTKKKVLVHGWVPADKVDLLKKTIEEVVTQDKIYLKFEEPKPEDKVPVELNRKGILGSFAVFTNLQGAPDYFEVNPTPIYAFLYAAMFGIMFGDIGGGAVFVAIGIGLTQLRRGFLTFSENSARKLGQILIVCGVSAIIFGFLYGDLFLTEIMRPILLKPLDSISEISIIALVFGAAQIMLAMVLNTINRLRKKDSLAAVFGARGMAGLIYYSVEIFLAIAFINNMQFSVFLQQGVVLLTAVALAALVLIFLSPLIEAFGKHEELKVGEKLIGGFGEGLETLIVLVANSVSYIRLAAFAIAHGALGLAAVIFAPTIGSIPSYLVMNLIVLVIEGFAALIQSLRLMYYEFSTKFYVDGGIWYQPFQAIPLKTRFKGA